LFAEDGRAGRAAGRGTHRSHHAAAWSPGSTTPGGTLMSSSHRTTASTAPASSVSGIVSGAAPSGRRKNAATSARSTPGASSSARRAESGHSARSWRRCAARAARTPARTFGESVRPQQIWGERFRQSAASMLHHCLATVRPYEGSLQHGLDCMRRDIILCEAGCCCGAHLE